ncbi:tetrapyrrole biosynthesis, uroporphyrinogen III synthase [Saitoella complicata NRRL Y-17804]|nr:tetrapyrrole biosynthesis, uroporphyrinogen III synthase [Saitoella complicata NRRL Y-17804]ODQ49653.1 tetrapyrrole biosynthesis, uroporphyrinogen III synthase [Saitoella complicata NRRL Y-17804]
MATKTCLLLKTRSTPSDPYDAAFNQAGLPPIFVPVLEHAEVNKEELEKTLSGRPHQTYSGLILTSQRAVEAVGRVLEKLNEEQKTNLLSMSVFTVGPATHKAIANLRFTSILGSESGNGSVLADYILSIRSKSEHRPLLFLVGDQRRDIIIRKLQSGQPSAPVVEQLVYVTRTMSTFPSLFASAVAEAESRDNDTGSVAWIIFFSPAGAEVALKELQKEQEAGRRRPRIATIGPTTEEYLVKEWKMQPEVVAKKPTAESLVEGILTWEQEHAQL